MDNTIIQQGSFTSGGTEVAIILRIGVDWMRVYNTTVMDAAQTVAIGSEFYWQAGMPAGHAIEYKKSNAANAANLVDFIHTGGFTYFNTIVNATGIVNKDVTAVSNVAIPVVTETAVNGLSAGDVVRLTNIAGAAQISGMDFTVGYSELTAGTFSLEYMPQLTVAGTKGNWQVINATSPFYPRRRFITAISQATQAVIRTSVTHTLTVGQQVRITVPVEFGMEIPATQATIVAVDTATGATHNTFTVDLDTSMLPLFVFPLAAAYPFTYAQVVPIGENTSAALSAGVDILEDATQDVSDIGMLLAGGVDSPAGQNNDVIYWVAGKSFNV